ncbi:MAG: pseudouridylate synthase [Deltaproteobacteria bacterium]|nr:pseudouridylate synthase [Deltaproteobacteria bacterium]
MTHLPFEIIYQDDVLFAINKPAWWVVHRGLARDAKVIVDELKDMTLDGKVYPLHRLDRQTSGVLLFARCREVAQTMQKQFDSNALKKAYIALVRGICPEKGLIDSPVPRTEGGPKVLAQTIYYRIASVDILPRAVSLVKALPITGRFHQIRRHMKHINHPVIGDANYGKGALNRAFKEMYQLERMALHAVALRFHHPVTQQKTTVLARLPLDLSIPLEKIGFDMTPPIINDDIF